MNTYDVIIVGGGVIGVSIAYQLSKRGKKVAVLERDTIGAHASSAAGGMLGAQVEFTEPGPLVDLSLRSRAMFKELAEELRAASDIDIGLNESGMLRIAWTTEEAAALKQRGCWQQTHGLRADWLDQPDVIKMEPKVSREIAGALYLPDDTQVSAPDLTRAFAVAAARHGAELVEHCEVLHIEQEGEHVTGIVTSRGKWTAKQYVLAAGAWSGRIAHMLGLTLAVFPIKGEAFSVLSMRQPVQKTMYADGCYIVPKDGNRLLIGASSADCGFDSRLTIDGLQALMAKAIRLLPELKNCPLEKAWASLRPQTEDGMPYCGPIASYANVLAATGHYRNGILLSPLTGKIIADMVTGDAHATL
ncbi:glycine oxidase ThiO [Aneurinibacillus sp. REN35]|uniref:glycine oxidase ThiO n=1 Tax=Aneurinibacillus sp. REN35 TaxID=3237286 RepID=UPI0035291338